MNHFVGISMNCNPGNQMTFVEKIPKIRNPPKNPKIPNPPKQKSYVTHLN
jgi:hypothetical protein